MSNTVLSPGDFLADRYEVINFHAAGGMQEVYRAYDATLDRVVALKTPKAGVTDRRFRRGAEMGARVNHPNIAATFDYFENQEITFLIEEFIPGTDLGKRLDDEFVFLDPALTARVLHHVAKALGEAHKVGICHRDLKPSNIMTDDSPGIVELKLTDFGIAKLAESEIAAEMELFDKDNNTLTTSNTLLGAVPYMAPECWIDWKKAGQPMDIWALGCIAYQLIAGSPPFGIGRNAIFNVGRLTHTGVQLNQPSWFGKHKSTETLERDLWSIILRCLQVNPDDRPTAQQVVEECNSLCYASTPRQVSTIREYSITYGDGGHGKFGFINTPGGQGKLFFHRTEFFGLTPPAAGQRVSFGSHHGDPYDRCAPVLQLKPET